MAWLRDWAEIPRLARDDGGRRGDIQYSTEEYSMFKGGGGGDRQVEKN